jgi:hypothetical protein
MRIIENTCGSTACPCVTVHRGGQLVGYRCPLMGYPVSKEPPGPPMTTKVRLVVWGPDGKKWYDKEAPLHG